MEKYRGNSGGESSQNGGGIDFGMLSDKELANSLVNPNSTNEERQDALETIKARERYGVFDLSREGSELPGSEVEESEGFDDDSVRRVKIKHTQERQNYDPNEKEKQGQKTDAAATVRVYRPIDEVSPQELQNNIIAEAEGASYVERINRENEVLANKIKNDFLNSNKDMRSYKKSGPGYLADGRLEIGVARVLADGYDELFGEELEKQIKENGEEKRFRRVEAIEDLAADKYVDVVGEQGANRLKRGVLAGATRLGATLEPDIDGDGLIVKYALPIETRGDGDLQEYMEKSGFDRKSKEVRLESYEGFCNILDLIKDFETPDLKGLNWYYENFGYNNNFDEFVEIVEGKLGKDEKAGKFFEAFWYSKLEDEKNKIDDAPVMDTKDMKVTNGRDWLGDGIEVFEGFLENIRFFKMLLPKSSGDCRGKYQKAEDLRDGDDSEINEGVLGMMYAYWYIKNNIDENVDVYTNDDGMNERGYFNESTRNYIAMRFGYNGKNNVIAEPCGNIGATYLWSGRSELGEADDWTRILSSFGRLELKRMIKDGDERVKGTMCKNHKRSRHGNVEAGNPVTHMENMLKILDACDDEEYKKEAKKIDEMMGLVLEKLNRAAEAS